MIQEDIRTLKKSNIIPIKNTITENQQYSLKQSFFDPAKSSPPNDFMKKLYNRVLIYESSNKNTFILDSK